MIIVPRKPRILTPRVSRIDYRSPLAIGLKAYWPMVNDIGSIQGSDQVRNLVDPTAYGTPGNTAGIYKTAFGPSWYFALIQASDQIDTQQTYDATQITACAWVWADFAYNDANHHGILGNLDVSFTGGWGLLYNRDLDCYEIGVAGATDGGYAITAAYASDAAFNRGQWVHILGTITSAGVCAIYINGQNVTDTSDNRTGDYVEHGTNKVQIGRIWQGDGFYQWKGFINNVAIWNRVLTPAEITELYVNPWTLLEDAHQVSYLIPPEAEISSTQGDDLNAPWADAIAYNYFSPNVPVADDLNNWDDDIQLAIGGGQADDLSNWLDTISYVYAIWAEPLSVTHGDSIHTQSWQDGIAYFLREGEDLFGHVSDAMHMSDRIAFTNWIGVADTLALSDAIAYVLYDVREAYDTLFYNILDAIQLAYGYSLSASDSLGNWDDAIAYEVKNPRIDRSTADSLNNWADAISYKLAPSLHFSDYMVMSDEITLRFNYLASASDQLELTDAIAFVFPLSVSVADDLDDWLDSASPLIPTVVSRSAADTLAMSDSISPRLRVDETSYLRRYLNDVGTPASLGNIIFYGPGISVVVNPGVPESSEDESVPDPITDIFTLSDETTSVNARQDMVVASLLVIRNGLILTYGSDYTVSGLRTVNFISPYPQSGDQITLRYWAA